MKLIKKIIYIYKRGGIDNGDIRDFKILIIASILNLSFSLEKLFIIVGHQLPDYIWFVIYGGLGLYLTYIAIVDYIHDEIEEEEHSTNNLI